MRREVAFDGTKFPKWIAAGYHAWTGSGATSESGCDGDTGFCLCKSTEVSNFWSWLVLARRDGTSTVSEEVLAS